MVKNITDYGVFIDLGGIDGLLHITDISWGRVNHPSEHFTVGDEVEVVVLKFDPETERVSLGYKQRSDDPWTLVDKKYPIGSRVQGRVVSIVDYGAFVEIEEGVEGLIHVSEMSWTKKVVNPAKILEVGDEVEAIVSELDMDQRRISLSLRQTERNPWEELEDTHPEGSVIEGKVRNLTEFGAFVEITDGIDGLIHVSDMSWTKRVKHPSEVLKKGDTVRARITNIDVENQRVSLSIKEFMPNEWEDFADKHKAGDILDGRVVNVTDFGLFIDIYNGLEGLAHVSEIEVPAGAKLEDHFKVGDWVRTRILRIEEDEKKVGLSMRGVAQPTRGGDRRAAGRGIPEAGVARTSEPRGKKPAKTRRKLRKPKPKPRRRRRSLGPGTAGLGACRGGRPAVAIEKGVGDDGVHQRRDDQGRAGGRGRPHHAAHQEARRDHRQHGVRQHRQLAEGRREDRAARFRQLPHPSSRSPHGPQSQDRRQGQGAAQADPLLQAGQGAAGAAQRRVLTPGRAPLTGAPTPSSADPDATLFTPWRYCVHHRDRAGSGMLLLRRGGTPDDPEGWWSTMRGITW